MVLIVAYGPPATPYGAAGVHASRIATSPWAGCMSNPGVDSASFGCSFPGAITCFAGRGLTNLFPTSVYPIPGGFFPKPFI
jgi:hypothetical protein